MLIIIEGPDNVGKGTQITNIFKEVAKTTCRLPMWLHSANFGLPADKALIYSEEWYRTAFQLAAVMHYGTMTPIFDRLHGGEWVYGKIYRGYDANFIYDIEQKFAEEHPNVFDKTYLITFIDDPTNLINRDDGLSFTTHWITKKQEVDRFVDFHQRSSIPNKMLCNIQGHNQQEVWNEVKEFLFNE